MTGAIEISRTERRGGDVARLVIGALGVAIAGLWAQAATTVDTSLFLGRQRAAEQPRRARRTRSSRSGTIWCVLAIVVVLLIVRWFPAARDAALAGGVAWLVALGLNELLGTRSASSLGIVVRTGSGPSFPSMSTAIVAALARRARAVPRPPVAPARRSCSIVLVGARGDVPRHRSRLRCARRLHARPRGRCARCTCSSARRAADRRPRRSRLRSAISGSTVTGLAESDEQYPGATIMDGALESGAPGARVRVRAGPARRPGRGEALAPAHVQGPGPSGVRQPAPDRGAPRVRVDAGRPGPRVGAQGAEDRHRRGRTSRCSSPTSRPARRSPSSATS